MIQFSIIIPVYNVEEYLDECIKSVLSQTFCNFEVLLINDGSTDNSGMICDKYVLSDNRVKVIHKNNEGLSAARNVGVTEATGNYLLFLDSDDYYCNISFLDVVNKILTKDSVNVLLYRFQSYDCIKGRFISDNVKYTEKTLYSNRNIISYLNKNNVFPGSAWVFVLNRDFYLNNQLFFWKGITGEDIDWIIKVLISVESITISNVIGVCYRKYRQGSISNSNSSRAINSVLDITSKWINEFRNKDISSYYYRFLSRFLFLVSTSFFPINDKKLEKRFLSLNFIYKYTDRVFYNLWYYLESLLGLKFTSFVLYYVRFFVIRIRRIKS